MEFDGKFYKVSLAMDHPLTQAVLEKNADTIGKSIIADSLAFQHNPNQFVQSLYNKQLNYHHRVGEHYIKEALSAHFATIN